MNFQRLIKRFFDIVVILPVAMISLPIIALMALLIRLESKGNPFFTQVRVGKNGKLFKIYKMRTLYKDKFVILAKDVELTENDFRITRVGRVLRRLKVDELPQVLNVLSGSMSLVGPRPDIVDNVKDYTEEQKKRLTVVPGLTGIAQVSGNTCLPWAQRIIMDNWYIDNWSNMLDFKILLRTFITIITGELPDADPFGVRKTIPELSGKDLNCTNTPV